MRSPLLILPLAALLACGGGGSDSTGPGTTGGTTGGTGGTGAVAATAVDLKNNAFTPKAIKVSSGATVTWTNTDVGTVHNVTFDAGANVAGAGVDFSSGNMALAMPTVAGTYTYHCTHHSGMNGTVQVQ
ncbi:MAG TPA: plastocyanin/azurin family copper-binding protein [Gemmatimonadaceae bacterium]